MNGDISWGYMVQFLSGNFCDEVTCLIIADHAASTAGKVTYRNAKG